MTIGRDRPAGTPLIPITLRWGVILAFAVALISGVSVFVNGFAVKQLPDAAVYTTLKNGVAALILIVVALAVVPRAQIRAIDRRSWSWMLVIGVIGGSVPFVLFFSGLAIASAPTAAFIHKTLFIWVVLLAVPFLGERLGWFPIAALGVLLAGQFLAAPPTGVTWGTGETMILAATLMWAVEVVIARRLLIGSVSSPVLGAARLGIGLVVLVAYLGVTGRFSVVTSLTADAMGLGSRHGRPAGGLRRDLAGRAASGPGDRGGQRPGPRGADHGRPERGRQRHGPGGAGPGRPGPHHHGRRRGRRPGPSVGAARSGPAGPRMTIAAVPGPVRFARYAYGPNRLGYCGPDAADELLGEAAEGGDLRRIRALATGFEGAWPYLELIARSNGIADPLDERVVEAYWLGGDLLEGVPARTFGASIETRFRPRVRASTWRWLATKAPEGAHPVHAFHVLDVFPVVGLLRGEASADVLHTIDSCRIRWGTVRDRVGWRPAGRRGAARMGRRQAPPRRAAPGDHPRLAGRLGLRGRGRARRCGRHPLGLGLRATRRASGRDAQGLDRARAGDRQHHDLSRRIGPCPNDSRH